MFIIAIAAFCTAYYWVNVTGFVNTIKKILNIHHTRRLKPLDCTVCLSVWIAVILYFQPIEFSQFLAICFGAGFISTRIK
jgi:hypothetical protein